MGCGTKQTLMYVHVNSIFDVIKTWLKADRLVLWLIMCMYQRDFSVSFLDSGRKWRRVVHLHTVYDHNDPWETCSPHHNPAKTLHQLGHLLTLQNKQSNSIPLSRKATSFQWGGNVEAKRMISVNNRGSRGMVSKHWCCSPGLGCGLMSCRRYRAQTCCLIASE